MVKIVKFKDISEGRSFFLYNPLDKVFDKYIKYDTKDCTDEYNSFNISFLEEDYVSPNADCILVD